MKRRITKKLENGRKLSQRQRIPQCDHVRMPDRHCCLLRQGHGGAHQYIRKTGDLYYWHVAPIKVIPNIRAAALAMIGTSTWGPSR